MAKPEQRVRAVRLRVVERLSYDEILTQVPVSRGTLSLWLKDHPLTEEEISDRRKRNARESNLHGGRRKDRGVESDLSQLVRTLHVEQTTSWKGRVAEAAVLLRLVVHGFDPIRAVFEGDGVDWFVRVAPSRIVRVQVRWAGHGHHGLPSICLRRKGKSRRKYDDGVIDFFVGYDLFTDVAYVFSWDEVKNKSAAVTVCPDAAERWSKLQDVAQPG